MSLLETTVGAGYVVLPLMVLGFSYTPRCNLKDLPK